MREFKYLSSLFLFYLKGRISIDMNKIITESPNTILKLIPLGKSKQTYTITQVNDASSNFRLNFKAFVIGIILAVIGVTMLKSSTLFGIILLAFGTVHVINAFEVLVTFTMSSGKTAIFNFFVFEKSKADQIVEIINLMVEQRTIDTNNRIQQETTNEILREMLNKK